MNKTLVAILAGLPVCAILLCSCASNPSGDSPPVQNGQNVGPIQTAREFWETNIIDPKLTQTVPESWGTKTIYKDGAGYTVQMEKRGTNNYLIPGACIVEFTYENGLRTEKLNLDAQGSLACNDDGYALTKYSYQLDSGDQPVVEERFFDTSDQPVVTKPGFALMTCTGNPGGRIYTAHFSNFQGKPAPSIWYGVSNVVDVQYFYLQGITPIVCGVFRDTNGNIIGRKLLKGLTEQVVVTDTSDDDDSDVSVPQDVFEPPSSGSDSGYHGGYH